MRALSRLLCVLSVSFVSQPVAAAPTSQELAAAEAAQALGAQLFAYDQAAWHATDRMVADAGKRGTTMERLHAEGARGYIVEPGDKGALVATFFGERNGQHYAIARYEVSGSTVTGGGFVEPDGASILSPLAERMIAARHTALEAAAKSERQLCTESSPNTIVLPPGTDGNMAVYLLSSTTENGIYPAGGHFRLDIAPDGSVARERAFMKTCMNLDWRKRGDQPPESFVVSHLLDNQPTEIHAFVSRNIPIPLIVITIGNKSLWGVMGGKIEYLRDIEEKD